jgi:hypothetical protein
MMALGTRQAVRPQGPIPALRLGARRRGIRRLELPQLPQAPAADLVRRYKAQQGAKHIERDFPHFVDISVPSGGLAAKLDAMY